LFPKAENAPSPPSLLVFVFCAVLLLQSSITSAATAAAPTDRSHFKSWDLQNRQRNMNLRCERSIEMQQYAARYCVPHRTAKWRNKPAVRCTLLSAHNRELPVTFNTRCGADFGQTEGKEGLLYNC